MTARPKLRDIAADPTLALMLALGFSSGLPFLLILGTQAARLAEAKVPIEEIGLVSWVGLCYSLKFLWAPIIDEVDLPWLAKALGRRRAWLLAAQIGVAAGLVALAFADPARSLFGLILRAAITAFAAATQDIVVDGWRIDSAPPERQGIMAATYNLGYRFGLIAAGAGALYIADYSGWRAAYLIMAALMLVGMIACLLSPRLPERAERRRCLARRKIHRAFDRSLAALRADARCDPAARRALPPAGFPERRDGEPALYRPRLFQEPDRDHVESLWHLDRHCRGLRRRLCDHPHRADAGAADRRRRPRPPRISASRCSRRRGKSLPLLALSVSVENFAGNFAGAALIAYMSSLTSPAYAASQYALLSSLYALLGKFFGGLSGFAVKEIGFAKFFACTSLIGLPVAALCLFIWAHQRGLARKAQNAEAGYVPV